MWDQHEFFPFCLIFLLLVVGLIIFAVRSFRRKRNIGSDIEQIIKAEKILKQRLANGEITEEEYQRIKETLSK